MRESVLKSTVHEEKAVSAGDGVPTKDGIFSLRHFFLTFWMFRRLLEDGGAGKEMLEKFELFRQNPGLLEKYLIASEFSLEVVDLVLSRVFGCGSLSEAPELNHGVLRDLYTELGCTISDRMTRGRNLSVQDAKMEQMQEQIQDLERKFCALQRQVQSSVALTPDQGADKVKVMEGLVGDVEQIKKEVNKGANAANVEQLKQEVALLKESEQRFVAGLRTMGHFLYDSAKPLNGIIAHLTREYGGNVADKGVVVATASSTQGRNPAKNALDLEEKSDFFSAPQQNSWICYDFGKKRVIPTGYSIRSADSNPGGAHPKSWIFEGSNEGQQEWVPLDQRDNNNDLNGRSVTRNFSITGNTKSFRFLRFRQTGPNHMKFDTLLLSALEVFGTLTSE